MPVVTDTLIIPDAELRYTFARSGGPGGQNVNKVETRVTVEWDIAASVALSDTQKHRLLTHLAPRIDTDGILHVTAQDHRTQLQNRTVATERLVLLVRAALKPRIHRIPTRTPRRAHERRLTAKKHRGEIKKLRGQME